MPQDNLEPTLEPTSTDVHVISTSLGEDDILTVVYSDGSIKEISL